MKTDLSIRLRDMDAFQKILLDKLKAIRLEGAKNIKDETDRILASTDVEFIVGNNKQYISYIEDFSFFFGYQLSAYEKATASGKQTEVVSFSGSKFVFDAGSIQIFSKGNDVLIFTGKSLKVYFECLDSLLSDTISFLKLNGFCSDDLNSFSNRLKPFLQ